MDPDSIRNSTDSPYPTATTEDLDCRFYGSNPPLRYIINVCIALTSIVSTVTFVLVRKFNATFVILIAMTGIMAFCKVGQIIPKNVSYSVSTIFSHVITILYDIDSWLMVLLVMFRFFATRSASGSGEGWRSGRRALIGIGIVTAAVTAVILPMIIPKKQLFHFKWLYKFTLVRNSVMIIFPGVLTLCFGGALLLNYCRPPGYIMNSAKGRSYGTVDHTGDGNLYTGPAAADEAGQQAQDSDLERELTRTVLVIALLSGIIYIPDGIATILTWSSNPPTCGIIWASAAFGWISLTLPGINFFLYLLLLSDFRAVYCRCCGRGM